MHVLRMSIYSILPFVSLLLTSQANLNECLKKFRIFHPRSDDSFSNKPELKGRTIQFVLSFEKWFHFQHSGIYFPSPNWIWKQKHLPDAKVVQSYLIPLLFCHFNFKIGIFSPGLNEQIDSFGQEQNVFMAAQGQLDYYF